MAAPEQAPALSPAAMIEVGCGWSSLLTAQVNRKHLNSELRFTCIAPHHLTSFGRASTA
jgi:hypothetical protein